MAQIRFTRILNFSFLPYLIFFAGLFLFFGFFADYIGFYQEKLSLFVCSADSFHENISQPGSLLLYLGTFLTTFCRFPAAGSLIISFIICLAVYLISLIIKFLSNKNSVVAPIIIGTGFFLLQTNYQYLIYNNLGLLLQISFFYLTIKYFKGYLPVVLFPIWYLIAGAFAWIYGIMYIIYLVRKSPGKELPKVLVLPVVCFIVIYILKQYLIFQPVNVLLTFPFSDEDTGSQLKFFLPLSVLLTLIPFAGIKVIRLPSWIRVSSVIKDISGLIISLLLVVGASLYSFDKVHKEYFTAEKLFLQNRYNELSDYIKQHPTNNRLTIFLNNIALCETGKLNDLLFHFPQDPEGQTLFLKWEMFGEVLRRGGYFYYTAGMINEAHRWAYENMVMKGYTYEDLKMLIKTELIDGNYNVASKYISILDHTLFYRKEATNFESFLFNDRAVETDPELGVKRREKIKHDFFSITDDPYVNIERVLMKDSLNRKAFEYKFAYLMLTRDYKGIAANLPKLERYGFTGIPVHLEEAALVCKLSSDVKKLDLGDLVIDPSTEARFNQFLQSFQLYGNNLKTAQQTLKQKFGDTFWYYAFYH